MNKKTVVLLFLVFFLLETSWAQSKHMFEVTSMDSWGMEYLTVTSDNKINLYQADNIYTYYAPDYRGRRGVANAQYRAERKSDFHDSIIYGDIRNRDVITAIDGISTKGMDEITFYDYLDSREEVKLSIQRREGTVIRDLEVSVGWNRSDNPIEKQMVLGQVPIGDITFHNKESRYWKASLTDLYPATRATKRDWRLFPHTDDEVLTAMKLDDMWGMGWYALYAFECMNGESIDWFRVITYDFVVSEEEPVLERNLMQSFINGVNTRLKEVGIKFIKNTNNPDIILRVATSASKTTETVYVPESSQIVSTGATATAQYDYRGRFKGYRTNNELQTVTTGGYRVDISNADMFLELCILDAKRMRDSSQRIPPIVWQGRCEQHFNQNLDLQLMMRKAMYAMVVQFNPFPVSKVSDLQCVCESNTLVYDAKKKKVIHIEPTNLWYTASVIDEKTRRCEPVEGLRDGDVIMEIHGRNEKDYIQKTLFEDSNNLEIPRDYYDDMIVVIKRNRERRVLWYIRPDIQYNISQDKYSYLREDRTLFGVEQVIPF